MSGEVPCARDKNDGGESRQVCRKEGSKHHQGESGSHDEWMTLGASGFLRKIKKKGESSW